MSDEQPRVQVPAATPVPTAILTDLVNGPDGSRWVRLRICSPTGIHVVFCDSRFAEVIGAQIAEAGRNARLHVASALVPPSNGHRGNGHRPSG